jgi:hypothetical protein
MNKTSAAWRANARRARSIWGRLSPTAIDTLKQLTARLSLSVAAGDLQLLENRWYVTHSGLLHIAQRRRCFGIKTAIEDRLSDPVANRWVFKATVYKSPSSRGFVGYGDADPSNVSTLVQGAEMRVAETRAVNRALRKAYGIGLCSVEELGSPSGCSAHVKNYEPSEKSHFPTGSNNGQPRLRDRLCVLIRQHGLDPALVKAYAADFCGTPTLREANRESVEAFVSHLATAAKENRDGLICRLNSYAQPMEVTQ